jgi:mono/diheme cytochrome c family protein
VALLAALHAAPAMAETPIERGRYLVDTIMTCHNCHTPMGPNGPQFDKALSGGLRFDEPPFDVTASNITPDVETGIGTWGDADVKKALLEGVRPTGHRLAEVMPTGFYKILTPGDLDGIVAYLRSLPPVSKKVRDPVYKINIPHQIFPGAEQPMSEADLNDKVKRGFYLATIAHCMECHSRRPDGAQDYVNWWGKGGYEFKDVWGTARVSNITSHPAAGIGKWTDEEIKRALVEGVGRDGRKFKPPMARHIYFSRMTEQDVGALIAWMRTIPPLE